MPGPITNIIDIAPPAVWIAGGAVAVAFTVALARLIRRQRAAEPDAERMSRLQLIGALAFSAVVVASFVIGTFEGGVAFADHYLGWDNWRRVIPWGSFDASSMAFSLFAIRAIGRGRSPKRAMRVVYASAGASACVQLLEGGDLHTWQGGAFLAALAVGSTMVVHSVIDQIRGKEALVGEEEKLRFRKRWLTSFPSTLCAWLAWTNFPPEDLVPTVGNALRHLDAVRESKRARMTERPAWWRINPWLFATRTERSVEQLRAEHLEAERTAHAAIEAERHRAEQEAIRSAEALRLAVAAEQRKTEQETERLTTLIRSDRAGHDEAVARILAEHAVVVEDLRRAAAERSTGERPAPARNERSTTERSATPRAPRTGAERVNGAKLTDDEAVGAMLRAHSGADYDWSSREVHRITGAGFGRVPKLIAMVAEHHERSTPKVADGAVDDDASERPLADSVAV